MPRVIVRCANSLTRSNLEPSTEARLAPPPGAGRLGYYPLAARKWPRPERPQQQKIAVDDHLVDVDFSSIVPVRPGIR